MLARQRNSLKRFCETFHTGSLEDAAGPKCFSANPTGALPSVRVPHGLEGAPMDTLILIVGVFLVAVIGRALLDPWPSTTDDRAELEREHLMEDIARSFF